MFDGSILIKSCLPSMIADYPMVLCRILNLQIEMRDILFQSVFSLLPLHVSVALEFTAV